MPRREHKTFAQPLQIKADGEETGSVVAVFSTFGNIDAYGDIMQPGSIKNGQEVPLIWAHRWGDYPVGKGMTVVQQDRALFEGRFFLDTTAGQEAYRTVKNMGALQEYSFGFQVLDAEEDLQDGRPVRLVKEVDLFEVSPVLIGANRQTGTLAIKAGDTADFSVDAWDDLSVAEKLTAYYDCLFDGDTTSLKAVWSTAFVNNLPDSSFAIIESGGAKDDEGKTTPRRLRHLPHHDSSGGLDAPHVRNGLARVEQITTLSDALIAKGRAHLRAHATSMGIGLAGYAPHMHAWETEKTGEHLEAQFDRVLAELGLLKDRVIDLATKRAVSRRVEKIGAALSQARRLRLVAVRDEIDALLAEVADSDIETPAENESPEITVDVEKTALDSEIEAILLRYTAIDGLYSQIEKDKYRRIAAEQGDS